MSENICFLCGKPTAPCERNHHLECMLRENALSDERLTKAEQDISSGQYTTHAQLKARVK